jgi:hypothetical protein
MMPIHRKLDVHEMGDQPHRNSLSNGLGVGNNLPYQTSPVHLNNEPDLSPLTGTEFQPFAAFDFDIGALNQFLTSGDLDAIVNQPIETPQSDMFTPQFQRPYPKASDAIKSAWFTNMEERDLENEAAMLRSVTYNGETSAGDQSDKPGPEKEHIDEAWRHNLNVNLVPQVFNIIGPLPSIEFLVRLLIFATDSRICVLSCIFKSFMPCILLCIVPRSV